MYLHDCLRDNTHLPAQRYFAQQVLDSLLDVSLCVHTIPLFIWFFFFAQCNRVIWTTTSSLLPLEMAVKLVCVR